MANHNQQTLYSFSSLSPPAQPDCCQGFASLESSVQQPTLYSGQSPFLQAPDLNAQLEQEEQQQQVVVASNDLPVSDMDLVNFLEMDDKTLSELTGVNSAEWNSLFNGQLDDMSSLDPMTAVQQPDTTMQPATPQPSSSGSSGMAGQPPIDRWLVEETQKLERQQKIQQQKLMELQQTLLKTEILKNQLQIASISQAQSPTMSTTTSLLLGGLSSQEGPPSTPEIKYEQSSNPPMTDSMYTPPSPLPQVGSTKQSSMTVSGSVTSRGSRMSTSSALPQNPSEFFIDIDHTAKTYPMLQSPPLSPFTSSNPTSPEEEPCKRKVHNLIEKKYRCSINDRICTLRDMVSKHTKDNKKLQKSAVLQKTIDFIHHLQNTIKKLQDENQHLRETLALTAGKGHLPSFSSPPNTPDGTPRSCGSGVDSGNPSSPDSDGQNSPTGQAPSVFGMLRNPMRQTKTSHYVMVVTLLAVFFINPLNLYGAGPVLPMMDHQLGSVRTLSSMDVEEGTGSTGYLMLMGVWLLRLSVAVLCFGWMILKSMPRIMANSPDSVQFWRLRKQAEKDVQKGEFVSARSNLETALSVINRPIPTSYLGIISGLLWSFFCHVLFQLVIGRGAVYLASMFTRRRKDKAGEFESPKKLVFGVTFDDVAETYHLLHQINMASSNSTQLKGMGCFLALNALNFAEADRPFNRLSQHQLAEMYFTLALQCHCAIPYASSLPMWYYFYCFRNTSPSKYATPLKWAVTEPGKAFLMSGKWTSDIALGSRLFSGNAALPSYSVTRAYCKELLCETFSAHLLPDGSSENVADRDNQLAIQAFKLILQLAKEANSCLLDEEFGGNTIKGAEGCSDSGFTMIQWWASVGMVSCYWSAGKEDLAEDYYPSIEALPGEMALQLAFKANRMYKRPAGSGTTATAKVPLEVVLQLCATTSNTLESSVANLLQNHSHSTETELHQLVLLQACDWLLNLKVTVWDNHQQEDGISQELCPGFYQDLETLSKLVSLLPAARSRLHLYKGCYQLIAGANPIAAQAMLNSTESASLVRRRRNSKDSVTETCASYSQEHAMAKVVAYRHLPASMEPKHDPPAPPPTSRGFPPLQAHV